MKRFLNIFLLALIAICCDKGNTTPDTPIPEPKPDNVTLSSGTDTAPVVPENGGTVAVSFTANTSWTATVSAGSDWCIVTPASGNAGSASISITTKENTTGDIRTATVVIKAGTASQSIAVVQKSKVPDSIVFATGTDVSPVVSAKGDTLSVSFTANTSWTAAVDGNNDWCIVTPSSGSSGSNTVVIAVKDNPLSESRSVSVVLQAGTASETITIMQQPKEPDYITLAAGTDINPTVSADGGTVKVSFATNSSWTTTVSGNSDICTVTPSSGDAGSHTITITVKENTTTVDRSRVVTIYAGSATQEIAVNQSAKPKEPDNLILASGTDIYPVISSEGGNISISFTTNTSWSVEIVGNADWLTVTPSSGGAGSHTISISVAKNTTGSTRANNIMINAGSKNEKIIVKQEPAAQDYITLSPDTDMMPVVSADGGTLSISFETSASWTATVESGSDWCTVSPAGGAAGNGTISIMIDNNTTYEKRYAYVTIVAGNVSQTIPVTQRAKEGYITFAEGTDMAPVILSEGGSVTMSFTTNSSWTATVSDGAGWCKVTPSSGVSGKGAITITAESNDDKKNRVAYVTIAAGNVSQTIPVVQLPKEDNITFSPGTDTAPVVSAKGGTLRVTFTTNSAWSASVVDNLDWCTISPSSGNAGTHTVVITVKENTMQSYRYPTVRIQAGSAEQTINIEQQPKEPDYITFSPGTDTAPVVSADGGKINISFTTNVSWIASVEEGVDWCKVTPSSGAAGNGTVTITVDKNATTNIRYANIRIIAGGAVEWISIEQQPREPDYITLASGTDMAPVVSAKGGTLRVTFTTNSAWSASVVDNLDWCTVSPGSGNAGTHTVVITVQENTMQSYRYPTVRIQAGSAEQTINIEQQPRDPDNITFAAGTNTSPVVSAKGGTLRVTFTTNSAWNASVVDNLDWCTISPSSGNAGTHTVVITVKENTMQSYRYPTVRIQAGTVVETINIEQQPRDPDNITFAAGTNTSPVVSAEGGTLRVTFTTNSAWNASVVDNLDWCTISPSSGNAGTHTVVITVKENTMHSYRYPTVRIQAGSAEQTINIEQQPKEPDYITFSPGTDTAPVVSADGGKINISFTTNVSWTASVEEGVDWCKVSPNKGTAGNGNVTITIDKNDKLVDRYGSVIIKAGTDTQFIYVQQSRPTGNEGIKPGENLP